jgi:hypothetical protein
MQAFGWTACHRSFNYREYATIRIGVIEKVGTGDTAICK